MTRPHVVLASHEVAPLVRAGGVGRHVAMAAELLAPVADVTVVVPSELRAEYDRLRARGDQLLGGHAELLVAPYDEERRGRFASFFHADAAEVALAVAGLHAERPVDLVEVDDYLGLGAVLADAAAASWRGLDEPVLAARLHTTWEMTQVLDRVPITGPEARWVSALERRALRSADVLIPPSAATDLAYERFYGAAALAPRTVLAPAVLAPAEAVPGAGVPDPGGPLRLLYAGRLQEFKGVRALVEAVVASTHELELVLAGGDTQTSPEGGSMRLHLERLAAGDRRIRFVGQLSPEQLDAAYAAAHLVVLPSRFESFGYVLREALARGRPILATPAPGFVELMGDPRAGWLANGFDPQAIGAALARVLGERERLNELLTTGAPREVLRTTLDPEAWVTALLGLRSTASAARRRRSPARSMERTTAVVTAGTGLERTLASLVAQDGPRPEIVIVTQAASAVPRELLEHVDALLVGRPEDAIEQALATRTSTGPLLLLAAGETLGPTADSQLRRALGAQRRPAFATAWSAGHAAAARPVGGPEAALVAEFGVAASSALLTPEAAAVAAGRASAPVESLAAGGANGVVICEELFGVPRHRRLDDTGAIIDRVLGQLAASRDTWADTASATR